MKTQAPIPPMSLQGKSITLRPLKRGDIETVHEAILESFDDLHPWMSWCREGYSIQETQSWVNSQPGLWRNGETYNFAVVDSMDRSFIGGAGLNRIAPDYGMANLGYWVRTRRVGEGLAAQAAVLVARFGFEELRLSRVEIVVAVGNRRSLRVAEKSGAQREGVLRNRLRIHGELQDAVMHSLVAADLDLAGRAKPGSGRTDSP